MVPFRESGSRVGVGAVTRIVFFFYGLQKKNGTGRMVLDHVRDQGLQLAGSDTRIGTPCERFRVSCVEDGGSVPSKTTLSPGAGISVSPQASSMGLKGGSN